MRLDKFVSDGAAMTRSESRKAIKKGRVLVENEIVKDIAFSVSEDCRVYLDGNEIAYKKFVYIMLNKPQGYVSATEDKKQKTVLDLLDPSYSRYQLFPVGRLDIDTEGFLLLTNDGELAHNMLSPNKNVGKTYFLRLEKQITDSEIDNLEKGVDIGECITKPAKAERICEREINLTITEGKFHQIKRMAKAVGNEVVYLKRLAYGNFYLDEALERGSYRSLTEEETEYLCNVYKRK
ncbi:MAG: rRNA pseudouridine synthase [Ruminococcaceae bacterium]|nr:rRNA pseudouridine synthase [Oscillospiraceae bacterium]